MVKKEKYEMRIRHDGKRFLVTVKQGALRGVMPYDSETELKKALRMTNLKEMLTPKKKKRKLMRLM